MIPIMREPTGLIIVPLRTEPPPPAAVAALEAQVPWGPPPLPPAPETQKSGIQAPSWLPADRVSWIHHLPVPSAQTHQDNIPP